MQDHYQYDSQSKKHKYVKFLRWFGWGMFLSLFFVLAGFLLYSFFLVAPETPPATSRPTTTVVTEPISVFRSPYYQFESSDTWEEINTESANEFRYRSNREQITEHDLYIIVNPQPIDLRRARATRVFVVEPTDGRLNPVEGISDSCAKAGKNIKDNDQVRFADTTFTCVAGGALFDVLVSEKGGTPLITMQRPDGPPVSFLIYYRDLRATPNGRELEQILDTFQTR